MGRRQGVLILKLFSPSLQIALVVGSVCCLVGARHNPWCMGEQVVHLFQRNLLRLRKHNPEEECVCEVANNEEDIVSPSDCFHGNGCNLSDHRVEGKGHHSSNGDTLGSGAGIKDFGGNDPTERTAGGGEGEIIAPGPVNY